MAIATKWLKFGLGQKLAAVNFLLVAIVLSLLIGLISVFVSRAVEKQAENELVASTEMLVAIVEANDKDLRRRTQNLTNFLQARLQGRLALSADTIQVNGKTLPILTLNGSALDRNDQLVDTRRSPTSSAIGGPRRAKTARGPLFR